MHDGGRRLNQSRKRPDRRGLFRDASGRPGRQAYIKAENNRRLQTLTGRGRGSIDFKHQNISAVLKALGETWIEGYKPAFNYQLSLEPAVMRWIAANPAWKIRMPILAPLRHMNDPQPLWIGPAPTLHNTPPPAELEQMLAIARKFDVAGRDDRNRALGRAGEEVVLMSDNHVGRCRQPPWPVGLNGRRACPSGGPPHRPDWFRE